MSRISLPSFIGGTYIAQSRLANQERTVNFLLEKMEAEGGKTRYALYGTPGVTAFATHATMAGWRATYTHPGGRAFGVVNTNFVEILASGDLTSRGTVANTNSNPATICGNGDGGNELFITSGDKGYHYDLATDTLTEVIASGCTMGGFCAGYFLVLDAATSTLKQSGLFDGTTWTESAQRTLAQDRWLGLLAMVGEVWLFGSETSEVWYPSGEFPFAFRPHPTVIPSGIKAPFSARDVGGKATWVSNTREGLIQVRQAAGLDPVRISHHGLETAFEGYTDLAGGLADSYAEDGHTHYLLTFPSDNKTWVADATTPGIWCERGLWNIAQNRYDAWGPLWHCIAHGKHLIGDRTSSTLFEMATSIVTDTDGSAIRRLRRAPALHNLHERIFYNQFELYLETGLGELNEDDPLVELNYSNDSGKTWEYAGFVSAGAQGEHGKRVYWNRLGSGIDRVFEVVVSDGIPWRVLDAFVDLDQ